MLPRDRMRLERIAGSPRLRLTTDAAALGRGGHRLHLRPDPGRRRPAARPAPPARRLRDRRRAGAPRPADPAHEHHLRRHHDGAADPAALGPRAGGRARTCSSPSRPSGSTRATRRTARRTCRASSAAPPRTAPSARPTWSRGSPATRIGSRRPEAAELCKLYENSFRAVNIGFANEMADASRRLGLDPIEVLEAAATKPYGFMAFHPGAGVGGHCIPCDPHYLLENLRGASADAPILARAMQSIAARPHRVVERARELLAGAGASVSGARVLVVGASYKPGVMDTRESPALEIIREPAGRGRRGRVPRPAGADARDRGRRADAVGRAADPGRLRPGGRRDGPPAATTTSGCGDCPQVLDCTYRTPGGAERSVI